jgi:hypothetical protein
VAGDKFRKTLAQVPTVFGRLAYLSGLRDIAGLYGHPSLHHWVGQDEADRTLSHCHHQVFRHWISFPLAEQKADLDTFLNTSRDAIDLAFCRGLIPHAVQEMESLLFLTDMEMLLELLRLERGVLG